MNEFLRQLSQVFPDDYIVLVIDNAIWYKAKLWRFRIILTLPLSLLIPLR